MRAVVSFLALIVLGSLATAQAQTIRQAAVLQPGDEVRIRVWRDSEMSGDLGIAPDGSLIHPVFRAVKVTGIPLADVESRIRTFLLRYQTEPQFVAEPLFRVTVGGQVQKADVYFLAPNVTLGQAVAMAGGANENGRTDRARLLSNGQISIIKLDGNDPTGNLPVRSGDLLVVERRGSFFREIFAPLVAIAGSAAAIINVTRKR